MRTVIKTGDSFRAESALFSLISSYLISSSILSVSSCTAKCERISNRRQGTWEVRLCAALSGFQTLLVVHSFAYSTF